MHLSDTNLKTVPQTAGGSAPMPPSQSGQSVASSGWLAQITNAIPQLVQSVGSVLQLTGQQRLASENLRRARQGLEPLTYQDVPGLVPTAQVGIDEGTQRTVLMLGGAALVAYLFMKKR